ncbi:MAG: hypothetical protein WAT67_10975 [Candidatus Contendobacter sp.]
MTQRSLATPLPHVVGHPKSPARSSKISPSQYALGYHSLLINDLPQKLFASVNITRYQNGTRLECQQERDILKYHLKKILKVKLLQPAFYFPVDDGMDSTKPFYNLGINRAYGGKGSPSEIADVIRLAVRCERIGKGKAVATIDEYARQFLGLDCNGLVGNYHALSPEVLIWSWAEGEPGKLLSWSKAKQLESGWGAAELATASYIPLEPRRSIDEVCDGDILITVTPDDHYKHIALVEGSTPIGNDQVTWTIVEWGEAGNADKHIKRQKVAKLEPGKKKKYGLGFKHKGNFRYLFANPNTPWEPATWGRCGTPES